MGRYFRMIRLKNVSKFYYSKGIIASGITKVNLDLDVGEFVVITGESGSGKSTLLNVISGLDTYEEGEMYIDGKETSHYTATDFENYRKKYIASIFQSFHLVSSYTVYQNVALALQIDGESKQQIRRKVPAILEKVGLLEYAKTKVSKLSGGQKQRVAIARALAKETQILVADEPTGNLDSESAAGIVELLTSIAKDKLVVVVTHNYEQFMDHATRVIKMYDGKIVEDTGAAKTAGHKEKASAIREESHRTIARRPEEDALSKRDTIHYGTQLRLGVRNTFNIIAKFLLLLLVFLFVVSAVSSQYVTVKKQQDTVAETGWNSYFNNYSPERVVVEKADGSAFTREDYKALSAAPHVARFIQADMMYDQSVYIENEQFTFYGFPLSISALEGELDLGTMPQETNEVVLVGANDGWTLGEDPEALIGNGYTVYNDNDVEIKVKVAGIRFSEVSDDDMWANSEEIYFQDDKLEELRTGSYAAQGTTTMTINGTQTTCNEWGENQIVPNSKVPEGYILISTTWDEQFEKGYAAGNDVHLHVKTIYYEEDLDLTIMGTYGSKTFTAKTGLKDLEEHEGELYVNPQDYRRLYEKGNFQTSVFVDDTRNLKEMKEMLERGGYHVLTLKDHITQFMDVELVSIMQVPIAILVCVAVFFIAYFVIRLILKSRGTYFAIARMLGMGKRPAKRIMNVEVFLVCLIAYGIFLVFVFLNARGVIFSERLMDYLLYMQPRDYLLLAAILFVMALLISTRFMRSIFRRSAMDTYREEA